MSKLTRIPEALVHANARLTLHGRRLLIDRILTGRPIAHVAAEMGISRRRRESGGGGGVTKATSACSTARAGRIAHRTRRRARTERRIEQLRRSKKLGPARIAGIVGMHASTVHRVLVRQGLNQLRVFDRPTGG